MNLVALTSADKESYYQFVVDSPSGSFLQSWEWGSWQESLGRRIFRYWILSDIGQKIAAVQLIKMPLPFGRYYLYAPYGPVLTEGESGRLWVAGYGFLVRELRKEFSDAVFIRIEPKSDPSLVTHHWSLVKTKNIQPGKTLLIDLTKSEEQLLAEMHHKTRYNIKVAQKHGVEIKDEFGIINGHGLFAKEAVGLIAETAKRQGFKGYGAGYYNKIINFFAISNRGELKLHIYKAIFKNRILASAIMVDFGKTRVFLFGGSSDENKNVMAPYLLHWLAIQDAKAKGMSLYDFWGTETSSGDVPGFVRFKLGFGGTEQQYAGAYDIVINKILYKLYTGLRLGSKMLKKIRPVG